MLLCCCTEDGKQKAAADPKPLASLLNKVKSFEGIQLCATAACIALAINIILAVVAFARGYSHSSGSDFVTVLLYEGKCSKTKNWSTGFPLLMNTLGTVILGSSNYCAQFLAAPTREDVDRAHARGSWLDIGVPSIRNIRALGKKKKAMWVILMLSTIPIHALFVLHLRSFYQRCSLQVWPCSCFFSYNSVVLNAESSNEYDIFIAPANYNGSYPLDPTKVASQYIESHMNQSLARFNSVVANGDFEVLTVEQCVNRFAVDFLTGQQTVVVLSNSLTWNDQYPIKFTGQGNSPSSYDLVLTDSPMLWMSLSNYTRACTKEIVQSQITNWQVTDTRWKGPKWAVSVPTDNGTTNYTKKSYSGCSLTSTSECSDLEHLENLAWLDVPPRTQLFKKYLDISD